MRLPLLNQVEQWSPLTIVKPAIEKARAYRTHLGVLYQGNCLDLLPLIENETIDTIFADPPFNLSKE